MVYLEILASVNKRVKVTKADVRNGAMVAEGIKVTTANQYELRYAKGGGTSHHCTDVMALSNVVYHYKAFHHSVVFLH